MREFDSEQQMKQTIRCQCTQFQFTSRGKGLILPPGLKVRPASSPVIRIRNIPAKGDGCILRKLSGARCATQRKQTAFVALFAVMSELGINCLIAQTFSRIKFKARKKKQKQRLGIFCFARRNSGHHRILIRNSANINRIKHAK